MIIIFLVYLSDIHLCKEYAICNTFVIFVLVFGRRGWGGGGSQGVFFFKQCAILYVSQCYVYIFSWFGSNMWGLTCLRVIVLNFTFVSPGPHVAPSLFLLYCLCIAWSVKMYLYCAFMIGLINNNNNNNNNKFAGIMNMSCMSYLWNLNVSSVLIFKLCKETCLLARLHCQTLLSDWLAFLFFVNNIHNKSVKGTWAVVFINNPFLVMAKIKLIVYRIRFICYLAMFWLSPLNQSEL